MKAIPIILTLVFGLYVLADTASRHASADAYARGWHDGYYAPHTDPAQTKVVNNLLCSYAEVACPQLEPKRHAAAH